MKITGVKQVNYFCSSFVRWLTRYSRWREWPMLTRGGHSSTLFARLILSENPNQSWTYFLQIWVGSESKMNTVFEISKRLEQEPITFARSDHKYDRFGWYFWDMWKTRRNNTYFRYFQIVRNDFLTHFQNFVRQSRSVISNPN